MAPPQQQRRKGAAEIFNAQNMMPPPAPPPAPSPAPMAAKPINAPPPMFAPYDQRQQNVMDNEADFDRDESFHDEGITNARFGGEAEEQKPGADLDDVLMKQDYRRNVAAMGGAMPQSTALPKKSPFSLARAASVTGSVAYMSANEPYAQSLKTSEELQIEKEPVRVRETGFWFWRRVIVPPNVYVVHTRLGRKEPITIGLGVSFRYNRATDSYLVVPAAMQTIGIVANGISREKQGINVLAYVQWQIQDFAIAYRRLDFSDSRDPLAIVSAQLREQAEAAIKDKIATMSVEEVLTDKEPVIEELTTRLKVVAEGRGGGEEGLGIKIVTVQIKEARVSSQRLWENLQAPFRYEKEQSARISELNMRDEIRQRELETRQTSETSEAETITAIERIKQAKQTEALQSRIAEEEARFTSEQAAQRNKVQLQEQTTITQRQSQERLEAAQREAKERADIAQRESQERLEALQKQADQARVIQQQKLDSEAAIQLRALQVEQMLKELDEQRRADVAKLESEQERLARLTTLKSLEADYQQLVQQREDELTALRETAKTARARAARFNEIELVERDGLMRLALQEREAQIERLSQEVRNLSNQRDLARRLIELLPSIAEHMPKIDELRVLQTGNDGAVNPLVTFMEQVRALAQSLGVRLDGDTPADGD
jgi:flotillin